MSISLRLAGVLVIGLSLPLAAAPQFAGPYGCDMPPAAYPQTADTGGTSEPQGSAAPPAPTVIDPLGDVRGARGPGLHSRELAAIAIYTATGDRDAADRLTRELRKFGVTAEEIQAAIDSYRLHDGSGSSPGSMARSAPAEEPGPRAF